MTDMEIIEKDLSYAIMKAAFEVHNSLGPGSLILDNPDKMNSRNLPICDIRIEAFLWTS